MKIGIIADPCDPSKPGGLGRAVYELASHLLTEGTHHEFIVYSKTRLPMTAEQRMLPRSVWLMGTGTLDPSLDLYIFLTPVIPLFFTPKRAIVVAHDFAYLDLPRVTLREKRLALASYLMHRRSLRLAEKVVCVSRATQMSAMKHFGIPEEKCAVVPIAAMPLAPPEPLPDLPRRFFLFAGVLKDRKNIATLIRAFALFCKDDTEHRFLIAGKTGGAYYESLVALVQRLGIERRVHFLGYVSDGQLAYLYSKATALIFASLAEGFGMPVLEAFMAGCPVITSNEGALAEVAGDAALTADPRSPEQLAACMQRVASGSFARGALSARGLERARHYSWDRAAHLILAMA